jgi:hypothetical protein
MAELHIDVGERLVRALIEADDPVIDPDDEEDEQNDDDEEDHDWGHGLSFLLAARGSCPPRGER